MDLSIIIVNYKTGEMTSSCIKYIKETIKSVNFEIIVVDNNSADNSVNLIQCQHPEIKIIKTTENLGYGKANNLGIKKSLGKYLLILNSDIILNTDFVKYLIDFYQKYNAGILGIKLITSNQKLLKSFGYFPSPLLIISDGISILNRIKYRHLNRYAAIKSQNPQTQKVDWITGAFMFISKENFNKIGGFDENIFMYYEDVDLCKRANKLTLDNYYISEFTAYHEHCATVRSVPKIRYNIYKVAEKKSAVYYVKKYYPQYVMVTVNCLKVVYRYRLLIFLLKYYLLSFTNKRKKKNLYRINTMKETLKILSKSQCDFTATKME